MTADDDRPPPGPFRRRLLRNTAATAVANGWTMVLAVASLPFLLHGLGATAFGVWALLQTLSAVTGWLSLGDLGVGLAATRNIADRASRDEADERDVTIGTTIALCAGMGIGFAALLVAIGPRLLPSLFNVPSELESSARFAFVVFGAQVFFELVGAAAGVSLDGLQRIDLSRLADAGRRTAVAVATSITAMAGGGLQGVALASMVATVLATLLALALVRGEVGHLPLQARSLTAGELLRYGRSVWALAVTGVIHRTMDRLVVGVVIGPTAVALVEIANQVQNGVGAILGASSYTVTSGAAWIQGRGDKHRLRDLVLRGTKYACLVTLPLCAVLAVLADPLLDAWLGASFRGAGDLVRLALLYVATQTPLAAASNLLVGIGNAGRIVRPAWFAVVTNLVASVVLVEQFGVAGAFVATIISSLVLGPLLLRIVDIDLGIRPRELLAAALVPAALPAAAAAAVAGLVLLTPWSPLAVATVGGVGGVVVAGLIITRITLRADERQELVRAFSR